MKKIVMVVGFWFIMTGIAFADYTVELKNEVGTVIKTYTVTTSQVQHLQKYASNNSTTVLSMFEDIMSTWIQNTTLINKAIWIRNNDTYIEGQAKN